VNARHAITDLRAKTPRVEQFIEAVREEIAHFFQVTGIDCHVQLDDLKYIPPEYCDHVLRVIGEGLSNVARHAQARHAGVEASVMEKWLEISVRDDGQGFDPASQETSTGHYGLLGLRERAHLVGGTLSLNSARGAGTTLCFRVPLVAFGSADQPLKQESPLPLSPQERVHV
jgi:two-component system, NarL family, sensor histidine kinase YdfH